jgi:hypothetical protein
MIGFERVGPFQGPGALAYRYECFDCNWSLTTVAALDLTVENRDRLDRHWASHKVIV